MRQPEPHGQEAGRGERGGRKQELAACAGMLAELLDSYLTSRFYHLLLIHDDAESLRKRLSEVEADGSAVSFFYFCKLLALLQECEREDGTMPPLADPGVHECAQRLLNGFLANIPQSEDEGAIDSFEIASQFAPFERRRSQVAEFVRHVHPARYTSDTGETSDTPGFLAKEFAAYRKWLTRAPPGLIMGTEALKAFSRLLAQDGMSGGRGQLSHSAVRENDGDTAAEILLPACGVSKVGLEAILAEDPLPRPIGVFLRRVPLQDIGDLPQDPAKADSAATASAPTSLDQRLKEAMVHYIERSAAPAPLRQKITEELTVQQLATGELDLERLPEGIRDLVGRAYRQASGGTTAETGPAQMLQTQHSGEVPPELVAKVSAQ